MSKKTLIVIIGLLALGAGWYAFRPERLFIDAQVNESFPAAESPTSSATQPTTLLSGSFYGIAHETSGTATIHQLAGGQRVLRFTDFETSNGPDVQVYLVAAPDAPDNETVTQAGFINLGTLKGNIGDQNYDLPAEVDLEKYQSVSIWCRRFGVNFGAAPLVRQ
jgi:hypothetical protein